MRKAPAAVLGERDFALHEADIFARPIIEALALRTLEANEIWLWHNRFLIKGAADSVGDFWKARTRADGEN